MSRADGLEVNEDPAFQRRDWAAERVGWAAMAAVIVAALLGLFGQGIFGKGTVGDAGAQISVDEYDRFLRFGKPTTLSVRLDPASATDGEMRVWVSREYLQGFQIQGISPQPDRAMTGPERMTYAFGVGVGTGGPATITFELQPDKVGLVEGRVGLDGGRSLRLRQFAYP